jgi:hypothetical protein
METILTFLKTALGIFVAMALWFLWMTYVRRRSGCRRDSDVLEHMLHGCAGCQGEGACHNRKAEEEHHELA